MIIDHIDNIMNYETLLPDIKNGMAFLHSLTKFDTGRYEFEGGYLMIQKGVTKPVVEKTFEAHQKYIDVQILLDGSEEVAWEDIRKLTAVTLYDAEKDVQRFNGSRDHVMKITTGMFYAAFPQDGHQPNSHTEAEQNYTKIVMKLPVISPFVLK